MKGTKSLNDVLCGRGAGDFWSHAKTEKHQVPRVTVPIVLDRVEGKTIEQNANNLDF